MNFDPDFWEFFFLLALLGDDVYFFYSELPNLATKNLKKYFFDFNVGQKIFQSPKFKMTRHLCSIVKNIFAEVASLNHGARRLKGASQPSPAAKRPSSPDFALEGKAGSRFVGVCGPNLQICLRYV